MLNIHPQLEMKCQCGVGILDPKNPFQPYGKLVLHENVGLSSPTS